MVRVRCNGAETEMKFSGTAAELLRQLGAPRETTVVVRDGSPISDNSAIGPEDLIQVIRVIYGG